MRDLVNDKWAYDRAIAQERQQLSTIQKQQKGLRRQSRKLRNLAKGTALSGFISSHTTKQEHYADTLKPMAEGAQIKINTLLECHPFIIGSATLESLMNQSPASYDYIRQHKFPFDYMWFEFYEPISMRIPFSSDKQVVGMRFLVNITPGEEMYPFDMSLYFENFDHLGILQVRGDPTSMAKFQGSTPDVTFEIDMAERKVRYTTLAQMQRHPDKINRQNIYLNTIALDELDNQETFTLLADLSINLINYINAHNVTVVKRDRRIQIPIGRERRRKKSQPFYLVKLKEGIVYEPEEPTGATWDLQWRVYVRGHDRKYRNTSGEIYKVIWIEPYVKGPAEAPWRHQRYEALARKLEIEKRILNNRN